MLDKAHEIKHQLVGWRREFHAHPEIAFQEMHTSARIAEILGQMGYRVTTGVGRTGVVAEIGEGSPSRPSGQTSTPCRSRKKQACPLPRRWPE